MERKYSFEDEKTIRWLDDSLKLIESLLDDNRTTLPEDLDKVRDMVPWLQSLWGSYLNDNPEVSEKTYYKFIFLIRGSAILALRTSQFSEIEGVFVPFLSGYDKEYTSMIAVGLSARSSSPIRSVDRMMKVLSSSVD